MTATATSPAPAAASAELVVLRGKLSALRTEFVDLAFTLERRGRIDAADMAITASARVGELCDEFAEAPAEPFMEEEAPDPLAVRKTPSPRRTPA